MLQHFIKTIYHLLGMMQLHVLDSGSVPVIKSCVSKSSILPGWKEKGLSFYVIKSSLTSKTGESVLMY